LRLGVQDSELCPFGIPMKDERTRARSPARPTYKSPSLPLTDPSKPLRAKHTAGQSRLATPLKSTTQKMLKETENAQRLLYSLAEESCLLLPAPAPAPVPSLVAHSGESEGEQEAIIEQLSLPASPFVPVLTQQQAGTQVAVYALQLQHNVQRTAAVNRKAENLWPAPLDRIEQSALFLHKRAWESALAGPVEELLTRGLLGEIERLPGASLLKAETKLMVARSAWEMQQRILATSASVSLAVAGRGACRKMCWKSVVNAARYSRVPEAVVARAEARLARYCRMSNNK
jgi:hypothetical protein